MKGYQRVSAKHCGLVSYSTIWAGKSSYAGMPLPAVLRPSILLSTSAHAQHIPPTPSYKLYGLSGMLISPSLVKLSYEAARWAICTVRRNHVRACISSWSVSQTSETARRANTDPPTPWQRPTPLRWNPFSYTSLPPRERAARAAFSRSCEMVRAGACARLPKRLITVDRRMRTAGAP